MNALATIATIATPSWEAHEILRSLRHEGLYQKFRAWQYSIEVYCWKSLIHLPLNFLIFWGFLCVIRLLSHWGIPFIYFLFVFGSKQEQDGKGIRQPVKRNSLSRLKIVTNKRYQQSLVAEKNKIETLSR